MDKVRYILFGMIAMILAGCIYEEGGGRGHGGYGGYEHHYWR